MQKESTKELDQRQKNQVYLNNKFGIKRINTINAAIWIYQPQFEGTLCNNLLTIGMVNRINKTQAIKIVFVLELPKFKPSSNPFTPPRAPIKG